MTAAVAADPLSHPASDTRDCQEDEMPARKNKGKGSADATPTGRTQEQTAADSGAASVSEAAVGSAELTRGEDEAAGAATLSALSQAAARRGVRDAAEGEATLAMAEEVAAGGALAAALSADEFQRGMELAGIAGQVQVVAELLHGRGQPTLAAFLGRTSHQLRSLSVDALARATEDVVVAHGAEHVAGELAALGLSEVGAGRDEYATSEALGAASAEMAAAAVRSAAAGATDLAAATAMGGLAKALATDGADLAPGAPGASQGAPHREREGATPPATRSMPHPTSRPGSRKPPQPKA